MQKFVLIIEDDKILAENTSKILEKHGYRVHIADSGKEGIFLLKQTSIDLVLLDRVMPMMGGLEVCIQIRKFSKVPIIMLTSKTDVDSRVEGLDAGATDYLGKPFEVKELLARIKAHLRYSEEDQSTLTLSFEDISLFPEQYKVTRAGHHIQISPTEFDLLSLFIKSPNKTFSKSNIINKVWGIDFSGNQNIVEVYVRNLRKKLEIEKLPRVIHTVHGVGYILKKPN